MRKHSCAKLRVSTLYAADEGWCAQRKIALISTHMPVLQEISWSLERLKIDDATEGRETRLLDRLPPKCHNTIVTSL
jgi:hypothetical protein